MQMGSWSRELVEGGCEVRVYFRAALLICAITLVPLLAACQMYETAPDLPRTSSKPLKWAVRVTDTTGTAQLVAREGGFAVSARAVRSRVSEADAIALSDRSFPRPTGASILAVPANLANGTPVWVVMYLGLSSYSRTPGVVQQSVGHRAIIINAQTGKIVASWMRPDATGLPLTRLSSSTP